MEYKEDILAQERELRDDPLFDLLRENRPQPSRKSRARVRRTLDRIETPPFGRLAAFARRSPVAFAAGCLAVVLLLSGTAYAISSWVHRNDYRPGDYLDTPPEQRTEASAIPEVEQVVQGAAPRSEGCEVAMIPEMSDGAALDEWRVKMGQPKYSEADWAWVRAIRPEIQEVLYDGTTLAYTIRLNPDHALAFRYWEEPEPPQVLEPWEEELRYADTRQLVKTVNRSSGIVQESWDEGGITLHTEHSLNGPLEGSGRISLISVISIQDLNVDDMAHIGCLAMLRFTFSFDVDGALAATNADTATCERRLSGSAVLTLDGEAMENMPVSLDGVILEETTSFRSTGVYLSYRVKEAPADWTKEMKWALLSPTNEKGKFEGLSVSYVLGGDETVYEPGFPEVMAQEDGTLAYTVILPLFPSDYEALKARGVTVRLTLHAVDSFNDEPVGDTWRQTTRPENGWDITTSAQPLVSFPLDLP